MARWRPKRCRDCKRGDVPISLRGYCAPCGKRRQMVPAIELHAKSGPAYDRWLERTRAGLDRQPQPGQ